MADVVEQGGERDGDQVGRINAVEFPTFVHDGQRPAGQVIGPQGVFEPAVGGAGVDQEGMAQLANVAEPLDGGGVEHGQGRAVQSNVVPQRVADDFELALPYAAHALGPAAVTSAGTWSAKALKFSRNIEASLAAWAS